MRTIPIDDSEGEVLAPFGQAGSYILGKRIEIIVTKIGPDPDTPLIVREALVGMSLHAIFTREQIIRRVGPQSEKHLPEGCLLAYNQEVVEVLEAAEKFDAAQALKETMSTQFDMYVFERGTFRMAV